MRLGEEARAREMVLGDGGRCDLGGNAKVGGDEPGCWCALLGVRAFVEQSAKASVPLLSVVVIAEQKQPKTHAPVALRLQEGVCALVLCACVMYTCHLHMRMRSFPISVGCAGSRHRVRRPCRLSGALTLCGKEECGIWNPAFESPDTLSSAGTWCRARVAATRFYYQRNELVWSQCTPIKPRRSREHSLRKRLCAT